MKGRILLFAALLVMSVSTALADTPAQARKAITALYAKEAAAIARKDPDAAIAHFSPDYVSVSNQGERVTREQRREVLEGLMTHSKTIRQKTLITRFTFSGQAARVRVKTHMTFIEADSLDHKPLSAATDQTREELWVKQGGKWLIKQSVWIAARRKISGQKERRF